MSPTLLVPAVRYPAQSEYKSIEKLVAGSDWNTPPPVRHATPTSLATSAPVNPAEIPWASYPFGRLCSNSINRIF